MKNIVIKTTDNAFIIENIVYSIEKLLPTAMLDIMESKNTITKSSRNETPTMLETIFSLPFSRFISFINLNKTAVPELQNITPIIKEGPIPKPSNLAIEYESTNVMSNSITNIIYGPNPSFFNLEKLYSIPMRKNKSIAPISLKMSIIGSSLIIDVPFGPIIIPRITKAITAGIFDLLDINKETSDANAIIPSGKKRLDIIYCFCIRIKL